MTREEAKTIFLNRGYIEVDGGTYFDGNKWRESVVVISEWLKEEPCTDAINRHTALDAMYALCDTGETLKENPWRDNPHIDAVVETIEELPPVNPQPKTGHWIYTGDYLTEGMLKCSECGEEIDVSESYYNFCPDCGAKMVEPQESEVSE